MRWIWKMFVPANIADGFPREVLAGLPRRELTWKQYYMYHVILRRQCEKWRRRTTRENFKDMSFFLKFTSIASRYYRKHSPSTMKNLKEFRKHFQ